MSHETHLNSLPEQLQSIDELIKTTSLEVSQQLLSPEQLQTMANIDEDAVKDELLRSEIMDIVGVVAGVKPSAIINHTDHLAHSLSDLNLTHHELLDISGGSSMTISRSEPLAKELAGKFQELWSPHYSNNDEIHRSIGKMLGYPKTSTDYFLERSPTVGGPFDDQLPVIRPIELENVARSHFCQLILSPDHWREELESYAVPLETATRELAPKSYKYFEREARRNKVADGLRKLIGRQPRSGFNVNVAISRVT